MCRGGAPGRKFLLGAGTLRRRDARPAQRRRHQPGKPGGGELRGGRLLRPSGNGRGLGKRKGPDNDLYLCGRDIGGRHPGRRALLPGGRKRLASVKVYWPEEAVRQAQGGAIAKDQREKEAFLAADWLSAELKEVAPAQAVALTLGHERPKLTFTLAGTMSGSRITALSVAGYDAYCDPQTGDAQLIMLPGNTEIALEAIGTVTIGGQERPRNFVVKTMPALKAGENHTIEINF